MFQFKGFQLYHKIILYALVFIGIITGLVWHSLLFGLILVALAGYLIYVIAKGHYFYRAMAAMILINLAILAIGIRNNYTNSSLMLFMMVDVIL
jgi:hypothetical protein